MSIPALPQLVIIASSNNDYNAGQVIDSSPDIKLANNVTLTLISESGKYRVTLSKSVVLWRTGAKKARSLILINLDNNHKVKTVWSSGQNTLYWPRLMPLVDGATYRVDLAGESKLPKLTVAMVPDQPTQAHAAVWMSQNGCEQQALRLLQSIN